MNRITTPIRTLVLSSANVRKIAPDAEAISALSDSICVVGLINPLTVEANDDGTYGVVAGGRRLRALQLAVEDGRMEADDEVECNLISREAAAALSLSENVQREGMHPADEFDAFARLVAQGKTLDQIACAFGCTPRDVQRRLKLAAVAPEIMTLYREGGEDAPSLDALMALAGTDDHERQKALWLDVPRWQRSPDAIRRALSETKINATRDRRTALVSVAEYEAAGGAVERDLFSDAVYLIDPARFEQMVMEKLEATAAEVQAEGWAWVDVVTDRVYERLSALGTTQPVLRDPTEAEGAHEAALAAALEQAEGVLEALENSDEDSDNEAWDTASAAVDAAQDALSAAMEARQAFTPQQKAYGGAIVTLGHDGGLEIRRGLVRREDRRPLDAAAREHGGVSVMGGRETAVAGRKSDGLSERALQQLAAAETAALRTAMVGNPRVALALLLSQLTQSAAEGGTCSVRTGTVPFNPELASLDTDEGEGDGEAFEALLALDTPALIERIVAAVAKVTTVDVSAKRALSRNETAMAALGIDMAQHFTPTVEWFGLISKAQILAAIQSANPAAKIAELEKLKKGDLCEVAARECADWTPEQLYRCPVPVAEVAQAEEAPMKPRRARAAKKGTAKSTAKVSAKVKGKTTKGATKGASQR